MKYSGRFANRLGKYILVLICCLFKTNPCLSQILDYKRFSASHGLITGEVYNLHQDISGYLWVFSDKGTVKYNGVSFQPVLTNLSFKDAFIFSVYERPDGRKWVANSNARIYEVRNDSAILVPGLEDVSATLRNAVSEITQLKVDDSLNIYAVTKGHSYKFYKSGGRYQSRDICGDPENKCVVFKTVEVQHDHLPVLVHVELEALSRLCDNNNSFIEIASGDKRIEVELPQLFMQAALRNMKRKQDRIYFSALNVLYEVDLKSGLYNRMKVGSSLILNYTIDARRHFWVACLNDGLYELDEKGTIINHYFTNVTVNDVLLDHEGGLWFSSDGRGLFYCRDLNYQRLAPTHPLSAAITMFRKADSTLRIGTGDGAVYELTGHKIDTIRGPGNTTARDITRQGHFYYVANLFSIDRIHATRRQTTVLSTYEVPSSIRMFSKSNDTIVHLWRRGIIYSVRGGVQKQFEFGQKMLCAELIRNDLWLGTNDGVFLHKTVFHKKGKRSGPGLVFEHETLRRPDYLKGTIGCIISSIREDPYRQIWISTLGSGLMMLDGEKMTHFSEGDDIGGKIINDVSFTAEGTLIISANRGLFLAHHNRATGQLSGELIFGGEVKRAFEFNGKIYALTAEGLALVEKGRNGTESKPKYFNLVDIRIDSVSISPESFQSVEMDQRAVEFHFDYITFSRKLPALNYTLTGATEDASSVSSQVIRFNELAPGNYTLRVQPAIEGGTKLLKTVQFAVQPHWWETLLFKVLLMLSLVGVIFLIVWLIVDFSKRKELKKTRNEQLLFEYKLIALKAQINPHFMSNCLSAIQGLILSGKSEAAAFYIARFGLLVRQILEFSAKHLVTLREELDLLKIYIDLENLRFENQFKYHLHVMAELSTEKIFVPPLILNPVVENAIWHGLLSIKGSKEGFLSISVTARGDALRLVVTDNGTGRKASAPDKPKKKVSHGIRITEQRLQNVNQLYNHTDSRVEYKDLQDENGIPAGTEVTIVLPLTLDPGFRVG